jgi:arabinogalactan endo-1,4-beta-galactosidase
MVVETGYYNNWYPENATYNFTSTYPASAAGQKKFLDDLVARTKNLTNLIGLLYWFPEENPCNNHVYEPWYNHGLFDPNTGKAVEALFSMKEYGVDTAIEGVESETDDAPDALFTLDGRRVDTSRQLPRGVYVKGHRKVIVR